MEEVERLDDIELDELADGMVAYILSSPRRFESRLIYFPLSPLRSRASRVLAEIRRAIL